MEPKYVEVAKGNVHYMVREEEVAQYAEIGFYPVDAEGNIEIPMDEKDILIAQLQEQIAEQLKEIKTLKAAKTRAAKK